MAMQAQEVTDTVPDPLPLREYIGAMALELARMARAEGDEALGRLLDSAAYLADPARATRSHEPAQPRSAHGA